MSISLYDFQFIRLIVYTTNSLRTVSLYHYNSTRLSVYMTICLRTVKQSLCHRALAILLSFLPTFLISSLLFSSFLFFFLFSSFLYFSFLFFSYSSFLTLLFLLFFSFLFSSLLFSSLLFSSLLSLSLSLLSSILLFSILLFSSLLFSILLFSILLSSPLFSSSPFSSPLLYSPLLYSPLLYSPLLYSPLLSSILPSTHLLGPTLCFLSNPRSRIARSYVVSTTDTAQDPFWPFDLLWIIFFHFKKFSLLVTLSPPWCTYTFIPPIEFSVLSSDRYSLWRLLRFMLYSFVFFPFLKWSIFFFWLFLFFESSGQNFSRSEKISVKKVPWMESNSIQCKRCNV